MIIFPFFEFLPGVILKVHIVKTGESSGRKLSALTSVSDDVDFGQRREPVNTNYFSSARSPKRFPLPMMCVSHPDCSTVGINRGDATPIPTGFVQIISDYFRITSWKNTDRSAVMPDTG